MLGFEGSLLPHLVHIRLFVGEMLEEIPIVELFLGLGRDVGLQAHSTF